MNTEDKKLLAKNFRKELKSFTTDVQELHQNSGLMTKREFLEKIANDVNLLYASSIKVQKEISADIEEIGSIIQNIFIQPLAISRHHHVTILKAVESFPEAEEEESDLSHIMREYVKHPESTKSFLRELELLTEDLDDILRKIA
ncbi:MAG: hypothetical protein H7A38_06140 [Chlamydiales bacterium]|nr:hypothetical protein [Chlamydiales bacterium]